MEYNRALIYSPLVIYCAPINTTYLCSQNFLTQPLGEINDEM